MNTVATTRAFDQAYIKAMVKGHEDTAALLKKEMTSGQDEDAKAFAKSVLPTVESHLKAARSVESEVVAKS